MTVMEQEKEAHVITVSPEGSFPWVTKCKSDLRKRFSTMRIYDAKRIGLC